MYKVGDKVFDAQFGWGEILEIEEDSDIKVEFNIVDEHGDNVVEYYKEDGVFFDYSTNPSLSFTEYDFVNGGFSQKRPKENVTEEHIGKLVRIMNTPKNTFNGFIGVLEKVSESGGYIVNGEWCEEVELYEHR